MPINPWWDTKETLSLLRPTLYTWLFPHTTGADKVTQYMECIYCKLNLIFTKYKDLFELYHKDSMDKNIHKELDALKKEVREALQVTYGFIYTYPDDDTDILLEIFQKHYGNKQDEWHKKTLSSTSINLRDFKQKSLNDLSNDFMAISLVIMSECKKLMCAFMPFAMGKYKKNILTLVDCLTNVFQEKLENIFTKNNYSFHSRILQDDSSSESSFSCNTNGYHSGEAQACLLMAIRDQPKKTYTHKKVHFYGENPNLITSFDKLKLRP